MTYKEYKIRVIDLLLEDATFDEKKQLLTDLEDLLDFDPDFIKNLYKSDCEYYDSKKLNWEYVFEDFLLRANPVNTLYMSL